MTDVCLICFGANLPSQPDLQPLGFLWNYQGSDLQLCLTFVEDMDTGVAPDPSDFDIQVDTVSKIPDSVQWLNGRVFQLNYSQVALNPVSVRLVFPVECVCFQSVEFENVQPFDQLGTEQTATAKYITSPPNVSVDITINFNMIAVPGADSFMWSIRWLLFDYQPTTATVQSNGFIALTRGGVGAVTPPLDVEFNYANSHYKHSDGRWLCPFLLENVPLDT